MPPSCSLSGPRLNFVAVLRVRAEVDDLSLDNLIAEDKQRRSTQPQFF